MKEVNNLIKEEILSNWKENYESSLRMTEYLKDGNRMFRGRYLKLLQIPKIYDSEDIKKFEEIVSTTYRICEKMIQKYIDDESYRDIFPLFSDKLKELILIPRRYESIMPIARFDIFYNEETKDFKFCEINSDGTSGAQEELSISEATLKENAAVNAIKDKYKLEPFELYDTWIDTFSEIYKTYHKAVENPYIGIVDFLEKGIINEFETFEERFRKKGYDVEICEIRDMKYINNELISPKGHKVDVVYRRAITSDIEEEIDKVQDFIKAVKDDNVCIIGPFCTHIPYSKWLFIAMWDKRTFDILNEEEVKFIKDHVPKTYLLSDEEVDLNEVKGNKDKYVLKPVDGYGSRNVYVGKMCSEEQWEKLINENTDGNHIIQEFCQPYKTENIYMPEDKEFKLYSNMPGLFSYNGKFKGVYSRLSDSEIISSDPSQYNKKVAPTLKIIN